MVAQRRITIALALLLTTVTSARQPAVRPAGEVVIRSLAVEALKGNLLGDQAERNVAVYLPPSYKTSPGRRYPTIYLLHGYLSNALEEFSHIRTSTRAFSAELAKNGIAHSFEVYANGNHENRIRERLETRVFRFFSEVLKSP